MKKFLYTIASNEKDLYCEQAFISITSLRLHNPKAFVALLVDDKTEKSFGFRKFNIKNIVDEIIVHGFDEDVNNHYRSRQLKTNMRNLVDGDFLYIDCDAIICENLGEIFETHFEIAAVREQHKEFRNHYNYKNYNILFEQVFTDKKYLERTYFNGGIIYMKDSPVARSFSKKWNENYIFLRQEKNIIYDQISLHLTVSQYEVGELDGIWNCQLKSGVNFFHKAKILHYFATNDGFEYGDFSKKMPMRLKNTGVLRESDIEQIKNPKSGFENPNLIIFGINYRIYNTSIYAFVRFFFKRFNTLFTILDCVLFQIQQFYRNLRRRFL